jgi:8-oxo-dGTP diphosphatase
LFSSQTFLFVVDCIIFGYDGHELKLLVIKRGIEPEKGKWTLVEELINENESAETAAVKVFRVVKV